MNATVFSLVLATVFAPPATTSTERSTRIYVRTIPPGASVVLDGKELGTTDGLFLVPPGVRTITLEMDGYDPEAKTLDVKDGWITRVEVEMVRKPQPQVQGGAVPVDAEAAPPSNVVRVEFNKDGRPMLNGTPTLNGKPTTLEDVRRHLANEPSPKPVILQLAFPRETPFKKCAEVLAEAKEWKAEPWLAEVYLVLSGPKSSEFENLYSVRWVIQDEASMTFEGEPTTVDDLRLQLEKVPNRSQTVLEVGFSSKLSPEQHNRFIAIAGNLAGRFGFKYASDIGNQKPGSKGSPVQRIPVSRDPTASTKDRLLQMELDLLNDKLALESKLQHYGEQHPEIRKLRARIKRAEEYLENRKSLTSITTDPTSETLQQPLVYPLLGKAVSWSIQSDGTMTFNKVPTTFGDVEELVSRVADPTETILIIDCKPDVSQSVLQRAEKLASEWKQKYGFRGMLASQLHETSETDASGPNLAEQRRRVDERIAELKREIESLRIEPGAKELILPLGTRKAMSELRELQLLVARMEAGASDAMAAALKVPIPYSPRVPYFQRTIHDLDEGQGQEALDLDAGNVHDVPREIERWEPARWQEWFQQHGVDLVTDYASNQWALGLIPPAITLVPADDVKWTEANDRVTEVLAEKDKRLADATIHHDEGIDFLLLPKDSKPPISFAFRTAQGTEGFLQIAELNEEKPKSLRLRWKLTKLADHSNVNTRETLQAALGELGRASTELATLKSQLESARRAHGPQHPEIRELERKINAAIDTGLALTDQGLSELKRAYVAATNLDERREANGAMWMVEQARSGLAGFARSMQLERDFDFDRLVYASSDDKNRFAFDLDEGKFVNAVSASLSLGDGKFTPPLGEIWATERGKGWLQWQGTELLVADAEDTWVLLQGIPGFLLVPADDVTPDSARSRVGTVLEEKNERLGGLDFEDGDSIILPPFRGSAEGLLQKEPPFRYAFRTNRGAEGLLQIDPDTTEPMSLRVRWKLTKEADSQRESTLGKDVPYRKIHLPDVDTKDTEVVLDLASGEMLRLPWEGEDQGDATDFTALGKGDLGFDSMLFCLRGGTVERFEDGALKHLAINGRKDDAKVYQLPKQRPCELVVTTAENRRFLVRVLSETEDGALDIEYRPFDPAAYGLPIAKDSQPARSIAKWQRDPVIGRLDFRIVANKEEAETFRKTGKDFGWYSPRGSLDELSYMVTRDVESAAEVLLWQTPEKSMTMAEPGEKPWQIIQVSVIAEPNKPGKIGIVFDAEGGRQLRELTSANIGRRLAVLVDDQIVACPIVRLPLGERAEITGNFSKEDLSTIAIALQAGMKPSQP